VVTELLDDQKVRAYELQPSFELDLLPPPAFPALIEARIDEIWTEEKKLRGKRLFNGVIYSLVEWSASRLTLQPIEYRHLLARRRVPELATAGLIIRPVAVTSVLTCRDGVVLGRRADHVAFAPRLWEAAPAGGLDRPDPVAQLMEELREELGLTPDQVSLPQACGLIEDSVSGVFDIVLRIVTELDADAVRAVHRAYGSDEYCTLAIVATDQLPSFLMTERNHVVSSLVPMLHLVGLVH
jgi:8-oxo-dGTP pyrophosphatase MutT (NUDIX family)